MADVSIDTRDLRNFSKAIRQASRRTGKEFHDALKKSAEIIVVEARPLARSTKVADHFVPGAHGANAYVELTSAEAVVFEVGNSSNERDMLRSEQSGMFKHKVFGRWTSPAVEEPLHPAVGPAAIANQGRALDQLADGVNRAFESVRLKME